MEIGQEVYLEEYIKYGWSKGRAFTVKVPIERMTNTQFIAGGRRFRKSDGVEIGVGYHSRAEFSGVDQTEEMNEFKLSIDLGRKLLKECEEIRVKVVVSSEKLTQALELIEKVKEVLR